MTDRPINAGAIWPSYGRVLRYAAVVVGVALVPVLLWKLSDVVLLTVGAVLLATLIEVVAEPLERWTPLPGWSRLVVAGLVVLGLFGLAAWVFGSQLASELTDVTERATAAVDQLREHLDRSGIGRTILERAGSTDVSVMATGREALALGVSALEGLVVMAISAVYLVAQPEPYRHGIALLFPPRAHGRVYAALDEVWRTLRLWLLGQLTQMLIIGLLTTFVVWLIGVHSPLALGLIAFVAEFVPYLGPILAAVPALLVAFTQSPELALWTLGGYLAIHQVEGNIVTPLIQRRLIVIPPALMLIGIAAVGSLFGTVGVLFAGPIVAMLYAGIRQLYVRDALDEEV
ncbi:AI-2E family transporter [Lichenibacterium dinghuense]|uniref:AI-2E family transporter n=1 Tax=Lichenibacterium dinghuense TaxID=2895977 RepID=UPI001F1BAB17|nr:AI-2E family transporter [Lichenibacterium sp. 6Y81]